MLSLAKTKYGRFKLEFNAKTITIKLEFHDDWNQMFAVGIVLFFHPSVPVVMSCGSRSFF